MFEINEEEIIRGRGPVSGRIMTREEYEDFCDKQDDRRFRANAAEKDSQEAQNQLDALLALKKEKENLLAQLQKEYDNYEEEFEQLDIVLEHKERLNKSLNVKTGKGKND